MQIIYVAHPYTNNPQANIADARKAIRKLHRQHPENWYTTTLGEFDEYIPYADIMHHCFGRIRRSDLVLFLPDYKGRSWKESEGCRMEYWFAKQIGKPILDGF